MGRAAYKSELSTNRETNPDRQAARPTPDPHTEGSRGCRTADRQRHSILEVEGLGLKEAVTPVGRLDAEKETVPVVKPFVRWMVTVHVPMLPRATLRLLGDAERLKFGPGVTLMQLWSYASNRPTCQ